MNYGALLGLIASPQSNPTNTAGNFGQIGALVTGFQSLFGGHPAGTGRMARRGATALARMTLAQLQRDSKLAKIRYDETLARMYPTSPVYDTLAPVEFVDIPVRLTTKLTKLQQLMGKPGVINSPKKQLKLSTKIGKVQAKIASYPTKHPESVHTRLATLRY